MIQKNNYNMEKLHEKKLCNILSEVEQLSTVEG